jgi:hypothetical protein
MKGNTLVGMAANGSPFKIYFLPGGQATVQQGPGGVGYGTWSIDEFGDVCVDWNENVAIRSGCFLLDLAGSKVSWPDNNVMHSGRLLGSAVPLDLQKPGSAPLP